MVKRREFLFGVSRILALLALRDAVKSEPLAEVSATSPSAADTLIIDALSGPAEPDRDALPLKPGLIHDAIESRVNAVNWTVSLADFEGTVKTIAYVEALVESDPAHWTIVRRHADLARAKREQKIGIMLGFQFPEPIGDDLNRLELFRRLGVRIMQLTYNNRSLFGDGCLEPGNAGLSKLGREAVAKMNGLGIAIDLSHSGKRTTAEAIEASGKPVLITHAGCNAIHRHPRNKDDEELRSLANRGGVIGIYFMPYLVASPKSPTKIDVLKHLDYALNVCGSDHVGIGSDGPLGDLDLTPEGQKHVEEIATQRKRLGIAAPEEDRPPWVPDLNTSQRIAIVADEMKKRGHSSATVEKVLGRNFHRALGEIWSDS